MPRNTQRAGKGPDRRRFLQGIAAGLTAAPFAARAADDPLQALIDANQHRELGAQFDSASRTIHMPRPALPTLSPATAQATEQAVGRYEQILSRGGWPNVPPVERLRLGNRHPSVVALRRRLMAVGDLDANAAGAADIFDSYVEAAVRRFQARHGISIDGVVRKETFDRLNVPCAQRLAQLKINVGRLHDATAHLPPRFVMVNIPAAAIEAVDNGVAVQRHVAIVGRSDRPSPELASKVVEINFNPYWTVPVSIVRRDLIPLMQKDPDYLKNEHIRVFDMHHNELQPTQIDWNSNEAVNYMFKQDPGDFNSLGSIRMNIPSKDGVYMHDTPEKSLFGEDMRFDSSGCVRVQNVRALVEWLLRDTGGWTRDRIDAVIKSGERLDVRLAKPVPVFWVYFTAWATEDGIVQFRDDIYHHDGLGPYAATKG